MNIRNYLKNIIYKQAFFQRQNLHLITTNDQATVTAASSTTSNNNISRCKSTHFGYQIVSEDKKSEKVHKVFHDVAKSYDLMNDAMSFGIHRWWKDYFINCLAPTHGTRLLDMAGGTGDITFRYLKYLAKQPNPHQLKSHVTISDINQHMLDVGRHRTGQLKLNLDNLPQISIDWKCADAECLPFKDESYTAYTIAFGIRNCTHPGKVLSEAYRILKPGGRYLCLEFGHLDNSLLQWLYDQYSFQIIPPMGLILAGQWNAYQYLIESIRKFPKQQQFKELMERAGFKMVTYENLTFGVVSVYSGFKL